VTEEVGLTDEVLATPIGHLSGGEFQRALVAFALLGEPDVLLLDEPTAGIDVRGEDALYDLLRRLHEERRITILLVSHDLSVVYRHATEVLCLNRTSLYFGPPREVLTPGPSSTLRRAASSTRLHEHDARCAFSVLLALLAAATAGLVGSFALMKRITLAGDAISHIALPGLGLALLLKVQPVLGGAVTLLAGALLIWRLQQRTSLATETAIGVIFTASLAVGALVTQRGLISL
jgi:hypothetical protein